MAQLVEIFGDPHSSGPFAIPRSDLAQQLDRLLLTVPSVSVLYSRLGEFLMNIVELDGVWLGSPDEQGYMHYDFLVGEGVEEYLSGAPIRIGEIPDTPLALAWHSGIPQFLSDWMENDSSVSPPYWRERGLRFGWRSSCAFPVTGAAGNRDVLILYSKRPHFFGGEPIRLFVQHLHSILGFALERLRLLEAVKQSQQTFTMYKNAMDVSVHGILIAEANGDMPICYVNPAFERITGYSAEEAIGRNCRFLQGTDTAQPEMETIREALSQGKSCTVELRNYRKNGTMFWNSISIAPTLNAAGKATHFICIQRDVTDLKTLLTRSVHSNALYRALMGTAELVVEEPVEGPLLTELCRLLIESKLFTQVWIGGPDSTGSLEIRSLCGEGEHDQGSYLPNLFTGDEKSLTVRAWRRRQTQFSNNYLADYECAPVENSHSKNSLRSAAIVPLFRNGEIWALLALLSKELNIFNSDLLELIERIGRLLGHGLDAIDLRHTLEEERRHQSWLARHDPVTDLLNRRGVTERVEEAIVRARQQSRSMAVALVDLNGFRVLHEVHGHPACDLLLRTVAKRLQTSLKPRDAVGRLGRDQFVLILEDVDEEKLAVMLPQILASVDGPIELPSRRTAMIQTSTGVTLFPQDDSTPEHLLRHADLALYAMRDSGTHTASRWMLFQPEADKQKQIRQKAVLALFGKDNVRVHYQPLVNIQTGRVMGVEALARLLDSDNNLLPPADFLPHFGPAELTTLTFQVLLQGIQDMHRLDKADFGLKVGINLEPVTLADLKAMQDLRQQIESSGLGPNRIVLELLEHADTLSMTGSREVLLDLKRAGARLSLDDVGSAYSSLLRIKELPVDSLKLDRTFLRGLERQPKELRFLMHLVDMAQTLRVDLIAEGVESYACRDALAALGVRYAQGYAIAMPMEIERLEDWLRHHKASPWTGPTTLLGAVALQLRDLFMTGRILDQKPSLLQHMVSFDPECPCEIGLAIQAIGPVGSKLFSAHLGWHKTMNALWTQSGGSVDPLAFTAARTAYEEEMFGILMEAAPCECETLYSL